MYLSGLLTINKIIQRRILSIIEFGCIKQQSAEGNEIFKSRINTKKVILSDEYYSYYVTFWNN